MVNSRRKIERSRLDELSDMFNVTPSIRNLVEMQESISLRKPIYMMGKRSKGRADYQELWDSLGL
jgi:chromosome partitioning protein